MALRRMGRHVAVVHVRALSSADTTSTTWDYFMMCWDRQGRELLIGVFDDDEVSEIHHHFTGLRDLLLAHFADVESPHLLHDHSTGQVTADDPRLTAVLSGRGCRDDQTHPRQRQAVLSTSLDMLDLALTTFPRTGNVVVLPSFKHVLAWLWSLTDVAADLAHDVASATSARRMNDIGASLLATSTAAHDSAFDEVVHRGGGWHLG
jgi:hypothetical protein